MNVTAYLVFLAAEFLVANALASWVSFHKIVRVRFPDAPKNWRVFWGPWLYMPWMLRWRAEEQLIEQAYQRLIEQHTFRDGWRANAARSDGWNRPHP